MDLNFHNDTSSQTSASSQREPSRQNSSAHGQLLPSDTEAFSWSIVDAFVSPNNAGLRALLAGLAIVVALVSAIFVGAWASNPESHTTTISALDEKKSTVMQLVAGSTTTSAAITLLPGDIGTPIAEKLLDLGGNFAIVIAAIYLEKYLLTMVGFAAFRILLPLACVLFALSMACAKQLWLGRLMRRIGGRIALFGILMFLVIPVSVFVTDAIDKTYETSVATTLAQAEQAAQKAQDQAQQSSNAQNSSGILGAIQSIPDTISSAAQGVSRDAQNTLNTFIETFAVMIVTSCVIPIVVLLLFLLLAKTILGVRIDFVALQALNASGLFGRRR